MATANKYAADSVKLRGTVASPGNFRGIAVVMTDFNDITKIVEFIRKNKGPFVLVAESTYPEYIPVMTKCIAFITEEGGLLSHAAITAREWGVPCIVGVKGALNVIRTGDVVEGDESGIIKVQRSSRSLQE